MAVNRGLVGLVAVAVLVWAVAFGGGLTLAVLTSNATVTTTFETVEEFAPIETSTDGDLGTSTLSVGNETNTTAPVGNATERSVNASASAPETVSVPPGNATAPSSENVSAPENETALPENGTEPAPENVTAPDTEPAPSENESAPDEEPAPDGEPKTNDEPAPDEEPKTNDEPAPTGDETTFDGNVPDPAEKGSETTSSDVAASAPTGV
jgi:outer membrane biosynthesis protein TonB